MVQIWRVFGKLIPIFLVVALVGLLVAYLLFHHRRRHGATPGGAAITSLTDALLALSILGILGVTLYPSPGVRQLELVPFTGLLHGLRTWSTAELTEPLLNVLLFVPLGLFGAIRFPRRAVVLAGALLSLFVEILQALLPVGRSSTLDDLLLNSLGTLLGAFIGWSLARRWGAIGRRSTGTGRNAMGE